LRYWWCPTLSIHSRMLGLWESNACKMYNILPVSWNVSSWILFSKPYIQQNTMPVSCIRPLSASSSFSSL
jgi:hypothetical protein